MRQLIVIAGLLLAACGQPKTEQYSAQYELNFMQACRVNGPTAYCGCVWEKVVAEIPVADFEAYERATPAARESSPITSQLRAFAAACQAPPPVSAPSPTTPTPPSKPE